MRKLYQLKILAYIGLVAMASLLGFLLLSLCIPKFQADKSSQQLYTIRHQELRDNNQLYTNLFLQSIKENNGYLVLGTSESTSLPDGNYYDFLNADTSLPYKFSVISGAGRTPCTYFPLIQSNKNVEGLKILFFINPRYWSDRLASKNAEYFDRYVSFVEYKLSNKTDNQQVENILNVNQKYLPLSSRIGEWGWFAFEKLHRKYYQDLVFTLHPEKFNQSLSYFNTKLSLDEYGNAMELDSTQFDFEYNVMLPAESHLGVLKVDTTITYRYDELRAMIALCKEHKVDITFIVGPYNQKVFEQTCPSEVPKIEAVCRNIQAICEHEGVPYIDVTDLSDQLGAFSDYQHHSSYGAYLIYQRIKTYVFEKEKF